MKKSHADDSDYSVLIAHVREYLPQSALDLIGVIGETDAATLIEKLGGTTFRVPTGGRYNKDGELRLFMLADVISITSANKLVKAYATNELYIPRCSQAMAKLRELRIKQQFDTMTAHNAVLKYSAREAVAILAREFKMCDRTIWRILKRPDDVVVPSVNKNGSLF